MAEVDTKQTTKRPSNTGAKLSGLKMLQTMAPPPRPKDLEGRIFQTVAGLDILGAILVGGIEIVLETGIILVLPGG